MTDAVPVPPSSPSDDPVARLTVFVEWLLAYILRALAADGTAPSEAAAIEAKLRDILTRFTATAGLLIPPTGPGAHPTRTATSARARKRSRAAMAPLPVPGSDRSKPPANGHAPRRRPHPPPRRHRA